MSDQLQLSGAAASQWQGIALGVAPLQCSVERLDQVQAQEWDAFVRQHAWGKVYHLSSWMKCLETTFSHIHGAYCLIRDGRTGRIVGGVPVYSVRSWLLGHRLISIPFASLGDPLVESLTQCQQLEESLSAHCRRVAANGVELKVHKAAEWLSPEKWAIDREHRHHFKRLDPSGPGLTMDFSETFRQLIRRAQKAGIRASLGTGMDDLESCFHLYWQTRHRLGLPALPMAFFANLWKTCHDHCALLLARQGTQTVGGMLCLKFKDTVTVEAIGDDLEARKNGVNPLLYWEALQMAQQQRYQFFSFGRTSSNNVGLMEFKRRWRTEEEELPVYFSPKSDTTGRTLKTPRGTATIQTLLKAGPAWSYRLLSNFCYRHWG